VRGSCLCNAITVVLTIYLFSYLVHVSVLRPSSSITIYFKLRCLYPVSCVRFPSTQRYYSSFYYLFIFLSGIHVCFGRTTIFRNNCISSTWVLASCYVYEIKVRGFLSTQNYCSSFYYLLTYLLHVSVLRPSSSITIYLKLRCLHPVACVRPG
jgi:hypothetical protein